MTHLNLDHRRRIAWGISCWLLMAATIVGVVLTSRQERTVVNAYRLGANRWNAGEPLYDTTGHGFLYFPQAAVLFIPWAALPYWWGEIVWRLFNIVLLACGTIAICRSAQPKDWPMVFPWVSLLAVLLGWAAVRTGQMTVVMTALMLFGLAELIRQRWTRAALCLWMAFALKPILLPLLLLVAALWLQPMAVRMVVGMIITAGMPFLFQQHDYVLEQYRLLPAMLRSAHDLGHRELFAQIFGLLEVLGGHVPDTIQTVVRGLAGLATLTAAAVIKRRLSAYEFSPFLGGLSAGYILLFNPRTESSTYVLIAPFLGYYLAARHREGRRGDVIFLSLVSGLIMGDYELGKQFLQGHGIFVLAPAATIAFVVWLFVDICRRPATTAAPEEEATPCSSVK